MFVLTVAMALHHIALRLFNYFPGEKMKTFILATIIIIGNVAAAYPSGSSGDRSHATKASISEDPASKRDGRNIILENAYCESATILIDSEAVRNYPMPEYVGCSSRPNVKGLALRAFSLATQNLVLLQMGYYKNPRTIRSEIFKASRVECLEYTDHCEIVP
jgi:hypothetical protein